ncbi:uncharacterized protein LOC119273242 [Triticum dicoccoides]|uniref:uncharacterized protein LOC119273242 n=1 Tax=Triticum dicoccoides TaxID=85692 RepID=UPI0018907062|nr:uncharacterized protein LOC119273242 [Triticum dicoccoides]
MSQEPKRAAMAAAPARARAPRAASVAPPAKRKKRGPPSRLRALPVLRAAGWSALPPDLVRRVADCLLATNDLDCYMDFRAVCSGWRDATDDPRSDPSDPRFRPRRWVILLDEGFQLQSDGGAGGELLLLLNAATGRFIRKRLPLLRRYYVVATTLGGLFVLANRNPPHAARVFNPLTGVLVRFAAPVPAEKEVSAFVKSDSSGFWPLLGLLCASSRRPCVAGPDNESFFYGGYKAKEYPNYNSARMAVAGGLYTNDATTGFIAESEGWFPKICDLIHVNPHKEDVWRFLVQLGGQVLIVVRLRGRVKVFKYDDAEPVPVESIGRHAIFVGHHRCLAVDADRFPSVEADCVYYIDRRGLSAHICVYSLRDGKEERVSAGAVDFVKPHKLFVLVADRPFTVIQLLCSYTINARDSQLPLKEDAGNVDKKWF